MFCSLRSPCIVLLKPSFNIICATNVGPAISYALEYIDVMHSGLLYIKCKKERVARLKARQVAKCELRSSSVA